MRHVSAEAIARFSEGDIGRRRAARISSHLASCRQCASLRDDLARVPALLASTEVPPLPAHLAARIQTALLTESARRVSLGALPDGAQPRRRRAGWPSPQMPRMPRMPRMPARAAGWAAAAAAAVVVAGGGTYLIVEQQGTGFSASSSSASSGAGAADRTAAGANVPAAPAIGAVGPQLNYQRAGKPAAFTPVVTDTNFVPGRLATQVRATLADYRKSSASAKQGKVVPHATAGLNATQAGPSSRIGSFSAGVLEQCVSRISAGASVVLVDIASYQAVAAAVIVTALTNQGPEQVWVVGIGCSATRSDVLGHTTLPAGG